MINYNPFWNTLKKSNETTYTLINHHHISSSTIDKLHIPQELRIRSGGTERHSASN